MKIGMMCLWNAANGPSIHAELVGRAWVSLGHQLMVFSTKKHPDARPTFQKDEDFVIRHFSVDKVIPVTRAAWFDPSLLLNEKYNVFVAQNVERLPAEKLLEVFPRIKERAVTVQVVHEGKAVVSSSVCQVLGSGYPILFHESNFVESYGNEN